MRDVWFTSSEIAEAQLPDLPQTRQGVEFIASQNGWRSSDKARKRQGRGGGWEYHISLLPSVAQLRVQPATADASWEEYLAQKNALWSRFNGLSKEQKALCERRLTVLRRVEELATLGGMSRMAAIAVATYDGSVQKSAYYDWRRAVAGVATEDWLAALAPSFPTSDGIAGQSADCHPEAWSALKSDYLRLEGPKFSAVYRRVVLAAKKHGWAPIPSERSLRRRLENEVSKAAQRVARIGDKAAKALFPAQQRSRAHFHAMQAVNMDGHKLDVFVSVPWSAKPVRMMLLGIQDLYSGKVVAHRLTEAETWEAVRLVIGDMVEDAGIPESIYLDNGRAFASKWITGDNVQRFRFKIRPEDPRGLLGTLQIEQHFTLPYSGQSKPIERAWGDLAESISKHPAVAGAYVGNKPDAKPENYGSRAIPLEEFRLHVAERIREHNVQTGRRTETAKGRSFNETFEASMRMPGTIVRQATAAQRSLWLLASEAITARRGSGEIHFQGNRYWNVTLNQWSGKKVTIRFDPDNLHEAIKVYDLKNRLLCEAECIEAVGFDNQDAARLHARARRELIKRTKAVAEAHKALTPMQLAEIYATGTKVHDEPKPVRPSVTRIFHGNLAIAPAVETFSEEELADKFSKAISRMSGGASILEFPKGDAAEK